MQQTRHQLFPWGLSFCIHATVVAGAVTLLHDLPRVEPPVYRMEFLLTDPQSEGETVPSPEETAATEDSSSSALATSPSAEEMIEHRPISEPSITQRTLNQATVVDEAPHEARLSPTSSMSTPVARPAPIERRIETAVKDPMMTTPAQVATTSAMDPSANNLQVDTSPALQTKYDNQQSPVETTGITSPDSTISPPAAYTDSAPSSLSTEQASVTASPANPQTSGLESQSDASQQSVGMNRPTMTGTVPAKSQYGWLAELLRRRTMSLLAYPHLARMQGLEGIVVVRTTINSEGDLVDAVVTKSSGYGALDDDALKLMHRVCPIRLPQDLGKSQITVSIPIRYRLDRLE